MDKDSVVYKSKPTAACCIMYKLLRDDDACKGVQGHLLPKGMDLTTHIDVSAWPRVMLTNLYGVGALPESLVQESDFPTVIAH